MGDSILNIEEAIGILNGKGIDEKMTDIYVDKSKIPYEKERYVKAINKYRTYFNGDEIELFSAPGRSEIGGNHTDHQRGEVLAASINKDAIAVASKLDEPLVKVMSDGYRERITISLNDLEKKVEEEGTTNALIRGVLVKMRMNGHNIGGFQAYVTSDVLIGAGLSSSAAFETLIGTILSYMYNDGEVTPIEIAKIGQYAENIYFGKPCGLMDQMACSVGNIVGIDFCDPQEPVIRPLSLSPEEAGHQLVIVSAGHGHADLTDEYAAIPAEMKAVAALFDAPVLRSIRYDELMEKSQQIREQCGDRALLRAIHFVTENQRAILAADAVEKNDFPAFLSLLNASGDSSLLCLQNISPASEPASQGIALALAAAKQLLGGTGACRVHGGGFAGVIMVMLPNELVEEYIAYIEKAMGEGSAYRMSIRPYGAICCSDYMV